MAKPIEACQVFWGPYTSSPRGSTGWREHQFCEQGETETEAAEALNQKYKELCEGWNFKFLNIGSIDIHPTSSWIDRMVRWLKNL